MPRAPRLHSAGFYYHVFARGNNRDPIFFEEKDYLRFLANLERFRKIFHLQYLAYCLMPNHFHLLLQVGSTELAKAMQVLLTAYTMYINKKYHRAGHLFQGRYQSIVVEKDTYLLQVQRYIHLNSIKAKIVRSLEEYRWSSYLMYLGNFKTIPYLDVADILEMFSTNPDKQKELFKEFTLVGLNNSFDPLKDQVRGVLGSLKFSQKLTKVLGGTRP